ncbi:two-component system sensor histidine kinase NtrB [Desulfobacula toluolica]|uniref:histidine kinase n=1 Tax=Desulfobacula toluolica (strain DSM 7467 / Tol2) TaxID=651182 RepID=K0NAA9_DESTT|nr:ATP-binding protein [Desulfobacula toluolica]CCK80969.1 two component system sensor histidine kinase [Desulfobacula toluolica Tol2]
MTTPTTLEDIVGLEYTKLGFFGEVKNKVAELQAANLKLERKQRKLQAILDGISDVMAIMSSNFTIISVNGLFSEIFKCENPEGQLCYEILKNRKTPCPECPIMTAKKTGKVCRQLLVYPIKNKKHQFEVSVSPMEDSNKKIFRFLFLMRDVTREKEFQEKYYYSKKMATVGVLAAGVAHEINNPLTSISGFSEGLKRRLPKLARCMEDDPESQELMEDFNEYIGTIINECNRCRDIVKNLLTFSPRKRIDFTPVNLKNLVTDVLKLLCYRLKQNHLLKIELKFDPGIQMVRGNAAELKQVLLNIICNAIDAVENEGRLQIYTATESRWVTLSVKDNGCGIAQENMDRLFDPFFTTKPVDKGTGIGLSTCYNIIKQHKGEISVTSKESMGSIFKIKFPNPEYVKND